MRFLHRCAFLIALELVALPGRSQTPAAAQPSPRQQPDLAAEPPGARSKVERLHVEDAGTRIDELRYGGETRSITVQPKTGAPAYEVVPRDGARQHPQSQHGSGSDMAGQRVWKVFGF